MSKREDLLKIAEEHLNESIDEEKLHKYSQEQYEFFYKPDVDDAEYEIDENLITGLLWDYDISFDSIFVGDGTCREKAKSFKIKKRKKENDKFYLFMKLAQPSDDGFARVCKEEFEKGGLPLGNGGSWCRGSSKLAHIFNIRRIKNEGEGNTIQFVELCGWNRDIPFSQRIRKDIWDKISGQSCVMTGATSDSDSENTKIEVDHKDGRKEDRLFRDVANQKEEWFQPLCKAANDFKRQKCKECKESKEQNKRWSAANIMGYEDFPFYEGDENYKGTCVGCYLYDPVAYRNAFRTFIIKSVKK